MVNHKETLEKIELGTKITIETDLNKIKGVMPTPDAVLQFNESCGMTIFGEDENEAYVDAFLEGKDVEFYTPSEDRIKIHYGGKVTLEYFVDESTLKEYDVSLEEYQKFVNWLKKIGKVTIEKCKTLG